MMPRGDDVFTHTACGFVLREDADGGLHRFTQLSVSGPRGDGRIHTTTPPHVGDTVYLCTNDTTRRGTYRIIERDWLHPSWGSQIFDMGRGIEPGWGVHLDLLVVHAFDGWYATEAPGGEDDE